QIYFNYPITVVVKIDAEDTFYQPGVSFCTLAEGVLSQALLEQKYPWVVKSKNKIDSTINITLQEKKQRMQFILSEFKSNVSKDWKIKYWHEYGAPDAKLIKRCILLKTNEVRGEWECKDVGQFNMTLAINE